MTTGNQGLLVMIPFEVALDAGSGILMPALGVSAPAGLLDKSVYESHQSSPFWVFSEYQSIAP